MLAALIQDGRISMRALAARLHLSRANVYARLERLLADGVIEGFTTRIRPERAGLGTSAYVSLSIEQDAWREVRRALTATPYVDHVALVGAEFDVLVLVRTPDNRVVIQAASAIVEAPGSRYNPLFVHGPAGAGISHLAHAVGNALRTRDGGTWCIACVDAGDYVEQLIDALQQGAIERWRARYRAADVLIVENVQALDGKERTQDEFFHLFNELQQAGRQMILTCDRPLAQLTGLQSRLRSRFEGGLVAEMGPEQADERFGRDTPVPVGDEAAAPTIDVLLDRTPTPPVGLEAVDFDALAREPHAVDSFFLDAEKVVLDWPGIDGRVVEELR